MDVMVSNPKRVRVIMDSQVYTALQLCEVFLDLRHNRDLVLKSGPGRGIEMGAMMHRMLEPYYISKRDGKTRDDAIKAGLDASKLFIEGCIACKSEVCEVHKDPFVGLQSITIDQAHEVINTYLEYQERWKNDSWVTVDVETVKGKVIWEDDNLSLLWKAKIDWLVIADNREGEHSVDHKTMSRREETNSLVNQFMGQTIVTEQDKIYVNKIGYQSTLTPEQKFERVTVQYSKTRTIEWITECASYAYDLVALQENGVYRHKWTSCKRPYGDCIYRHICEGEPSDRQRLVLRDFRVAQKWDVVND